MTAALTVINTPNIDPLTLPFEQLKAGYQRQLFPSEDERRDRLNRLLKMLKAHRAELAAAIDQDWSGRAPTETDILEVFPAIEAIKHNRKHLHRWMKPRKQGVSIWFKPGKAWIQPQPLGVVGIVSPWNYPLFLTLAAVAGAFAAGNRVMVKPSEFTGRFGEVLAAAVAAHFAPDELVVINGGVETSQAFCALPFDHLLYTGSTAVGKAVMRAAAENLTPVTLELGGKSPVIIGTDSSLVLAAERIVSTKLMNAGQICVTADYVLLPVGSEEKFVNEAKRVARARYPNWPQDFSALATPRQRERIAAVIADAESKGAQLIKLIDAEDTATHFVPRIVLHATDDMRVMQEEIFGPLLPVLSYRALVDAIAYVNARPRPLALYYFGYHRQDIDKVLHETHSGGVTLNDCLLHVGQEALPFGGIGPSGMGHYHGEFGFNTFSKLKPIFHQSRYNGAPLLYPPFGGRVRAMLKFMLG
ncbi:coniferyl aldehyde dehydrogenase [Permianibacter sp. IMCC34836]|uniref:coniferyl aldehyde dehydrogenase n=1 Tax=Permianibacter fluminis TaxID=2738515 RepID=UPI001556B1D9|nr:coniferyl aldehyde dehydrogenase [Permianibacter fluminis]NQD36301.1 coniferyl aldehyde dehydrogenase [Permianibacter fluminis]